MIIIRNPGSPALIPFTNSTKVTPLADATVFADFFSETHLKTFRYLMVLCGGRAQEAEDLTAEAYLRAWKNRLQFRGSGDQSLYWILTIARHLFIDHHRSAVVQPPEVDLSDEQPGSTLEAEEALVVGDEMQTLLEALSYVSIVEREIIYLRYGLGWRVAQIADRLGKKENTVSVMLRRTLQRMRVLLADKEGTS